MAKFDHLLIISRLVAVLMIIACAASLAGAQSYDPGPAPTIGDIQHQTVSTAPLLDRSRTEIGIGESVDCWIDPNTWFDIDFEYDPETGQYDIPVFDGIGSMTWYCSNDGTVYPTTGNTTRVYAKPVTYNTTIVLGCEITDSQTKGGPERVVKVLQFIAKIPAGFFSVTRQQDNPYGVQNAANPVTIGASTDFIIEVAPTTVDFTGLQVNEIVAHGTFTTCHGDVIDIPANNSANTLVSGPVATDHGVLQFQNAFGDNCATGLQKENVIKDKNTGIYTKQTWDVAQTMTFGFQQFPFAQDTHSFELNPANATKAGNARAAWNNTWGNPQGPYNP